MKKILKIINWKFNDIFKMLFGSFICCLAINIFIVPNHLYTGGILGLAQIIRSIIIDLFHIKSSYDFSGIIYYLMNIPLFVLAYKNISKTFFYRTLLAVTAQTIMLSSIPTIGILDDIMTNVLVGGILSGVGLGMVLSSGASSGGTDIIGVSIAKRKSDFSVGKLGLIVNLVIYLIAGIMYGVEIMIYSIIYAVFDSIMIDKMHEQNICSTAFIFCKKNPKKINDFIVNVLHRDFTYWDAKGGYDDSRTYIIYAVLTKYELIKLKRNLKHFDSNAFMITSEGVGIKGEFEKEF